MLKELVDKKKDIIKKYTIEGNYICVHYLNGKIEKIEYSPENLKKITGKMIGQAYTILSHISNEEFIQDRILHIEPAMLGCLMAFLTASIVYNCSNPDYIIPNCITEAAIVILGFIGTKSYCKYKATDLREKREKLKMYLLRHASYEEHSLDSELYKDVENKGELSINTLDNYSFEDICRIQQNLFDIQTGKTRKRS